MKINVRHATHYRYETPAKYIIQLLRKTPSTYDGQIVRSWRIDLDQDAHLNEAIDAFGNVTHGFSLDGPVTSLTVTVEGVVSVDDTGGVVHSTRERFPADLYLRDTALTEPSPEIKAFAADTKGGSDATLLDQLHAINTAINSDMRFDVEPTSVETTAGAAFLAKHGVCQDFAHIFIATARELGVPARYVSGYFHRTDGVIEQDAGHAWAEAFVPNLGWVGFDPAHGMCVTDHYIRVAVALDYQGAAPVRGSRIGGEPEHMDVSLAIDQATRHSTQ
ncbi:MAG: transglutaminase family protein [Pseudomonadota bacterium]